MFVWDHVQIVWLNKWIWMNSPYAKRIRIISDSFVCFQQNDNLWNVQMLWYFAFYRMTPDKIATCCFKFCKKAKFVERFFRWSFFSTIKHEANYVSKQLKNEKKNNDFAKTNNWAFHIIHSFCFMRKKNVSWFYSHPYLSSF